MPLPFRVYGHVDVDAFYASAAQVRNPFLMGKPLGVLSNQAYFVIAKSLELKKYGVKTGEPLPDAIAKCPHAIFVKRDFAWYNALSDRFHAFMRKMVSPVCEEYSVDECFFVMPQYEDASTFAEKVRGLVKKYIGLPVTVGLGRSKTLAKLISDTAKPNGAKAVLTEAEEHKLLGNLAVTEVSGIAGRRARRMEPYGIKTCLDYINTPVARIRQILTVEGAKLWNELRGDPVSKVQTERQRYKILTRGGSIGSATNKPDRAWAFVVKNLERLIEELHRHQLKTGRVEFHLEQRSYDYQMYHFGTGSNLEAPTDRFDLLVEVFEQLFRRTYQRHLLVSRMHLLAHRLESAATAQRGLFDPPDEPERTLAVTKRRINTDVSRFAIRSGATLPIKDWYDDPALGEEAIAPQRTVW
ncbi:MAG: nucleotidyltransferase [Planctomycetia bacterium]|nr:nucleotidyltransferase [Planctomycetia bacterium]